MAELLTVEQGRRILEDLNIRHTDLRVKDLNVQISENDTVHVDLGDGGMTLISPEAGCLSAFGDLTGLKVRNFREYVDDPDLTQKMIRHCLRKRENTIRFVTAGGNVVEVLPANTPWFPPVELYDTVVNHDIFKRAGIRGVERIRVQSGCFEARFITEIAAEPPRRVGDISQAGVAIRWNGQILVEPFVYTLACTNGLIGSQRITVKRADSLETLKSLFNRALATGAEGSHQLLDRLIQLDNVEVERPEQVITAIGREHRLSSRHVMNMVERVPTWDGGVRTMYDVVSLITNYANSIDNSNVQRRLQRVGGTVAEAPQEDRCRLCGSVVRA